MIILSLWVVTACTKSENPDVDPVMERVNSIAAEYDLEPVSLTDSTREQLIQFYSRMSEEEIRSLFEEFSSRNKKEASFKGITEKYVNLAKEAKTKEEVDSLYEVYKKLEKDHFGN